MDEIICYTAYLPEGKEQSITFEELLLDDNWADGRIECSEEIFSEIGGKNNKLTAKQNYEFLLRAVQKYPLKAVGTASEECLSEPLHVTWEEYRTDCYIAGKYQQELLSAGYFSIVTETLLENALQLPDPGGAVTWLKKMISYAPEYYEIDDDTLPILIYRDSNFCRNVLGSFADELARALRAYRQRVILFDWPKNGLSLVEFAGQRFKAVIGIQTYAFSAIMQDRKTYLHDLIAGPKYHMIMDPPIYLRDLFEKAPDDYYIMVHDRNYQSFVKRYWPKVRDCYCFPPGALQLWEGESEASGHFSASFWEEKQYDLTFVGSYRNYRDFLEMLISLKNPYRTLAARFLHIMHRNPNYPSEKAFQKMLEYYGIKSSDLDFLNLFEMLRYVNTCILSYYREKVICAILDAGIEIHVYGDSWDKAPFVKHECLICHPGLEVEESLYIMRQSKISLNIMSWHKDGLTERVLNGMLSGAVVLSDKSTRLEEEFVDGEDIILFDLAQLDTLSERVKELLSDDERMKKIAVNGEKKVREKHLWMHRAKELLDIISAHKRQ